MTEPGSEPPALYELRGNSGFFAADAGAAPDTTPGEGDDANGEGDDGENGPAAAAVQNPAGPAPSSPAPLGNGRGDG